MSGGISGSSSPTSLIGLKEGAGPLLSSRDWLDDVESSLPIVSYSDHTASDILTHGGVHWDTRDLGQNPTKSEGAESPS